MGDQDELRRNVVVVCLAGETQREKAGKVRGGWCVQRGSSRTPEASVGKTQGLRFPARRALNVPPVGTGAPPGVTRSHWYWMEGKPTKVCLVKLWFFQWYCMDVRVGL